MRKILASLFVVVALLGVGVFATGAYFQFQDSQTFTIKAGTATLIVTPEAADMSSANKVGPGFSAYTCSKIQNDGDFTLNVTESLAFPLGEPGLLDAVSLNISVASAGCPGPGATFYPLRAYIDNPQTLSASLAAGAVVYVLQTLNWVETGADQSGLMGKLLDIKGTITGQTLP